METASRRNLGFAGVGSVSGGVFNRVSINGNGRVEGDVDCNRLKAQGKSEVEGNVKAQLIDVKGNLMILGALDANIAHVRGQIKVVGKGTVKEISIYGRGDMHEFFAGERIKVQGGLSVAGNCTVDQFFLRGECNLGGLLSAENIDIRLHGSSRATQIEGSIVKIKRESPFGFFGMMSSLFQKERSLSVESIEGDAIILEDTRAKVVRGNSVIIGPGCEIEHVEYRNHLHQHEEATVRSKKQYS